MAVGDVRTYILDGNDQEARPPSGRTELTLSIIKIDVSHGFGSSGTAIDIRNGADENELSSGAITETEALILSSRIGIDNSTYLITNGTASKYLVTTVEV